MGRYFRCAAGHLEVEKGFFVKLEKVGHWRYCEQPPKRKCFPAEFSFLIFGLGIIYIRPPPHATCVLRRAFFDNIRILVPSHVNVAAKL